MNAAATTRLDRFVHFGRTPESIAGVEDSGRVPRAIFTALLMWAGGIIPFISVLQHDGNATAASLGLYLSLGPFLVVGYVVTRLTGKILGILPLAAILWVTLLGTVSDFYMESAPIIALVLTATFVAWMGTSVSPQYLAATIGGVLVSGVLSADEYLIDRLIVVGLGAAFVVFVVGKRSDEIHQATSDREVLLARLAHESRHDNLTGLGNRALLVDELSHVLADQRPGVVGLALIDLDLFKQINDDHGHLTGDEVLVEIGRRLQAYALDRGTAVRIGGDEFALLIDSPTAPATEMTRELEAALRWSWVREGASIEIGASVGVSIRDRRSASLEGLFSAADRAMYERKAQRRLDETV